MYAISGSTSSETLLTVISRTAIEHTLNLKSIRALQNSRENQALHSVLVELTVPFQFYNQGVC